jgi:hypothetical protein
MHNLTWSDDEASRVIVCDGEFIGNDEDSDEGK